MLQYEQMPKLAPLPIIGLPLAKGWSQVCETSDHQLCFSIAISGENAANIGRDISQKIKQSLIRNAQELHQFCLDLLAHVNHLGNEIQFAGTLLETDKYTFITYRGSILLKRGQKVGIIISSGSELKIIQGKAQAEDSLVLATNDSHYFIKEVQLKLEQGFQAQMIATSLITGITNLENSSTVAIAIVKQKDKQDNLQTPEQKSQKELSINLDLGFSETQPKPKLKTEIPDQLANTNVSAEKSEKAEEPALAAESESDLKTEFKPTPTKNKIKIKLPKLKLNKLLIGTKKFLKPLNLLKKIKLSKIKISLNLLKSPIRIIKKLKRKISLKNQYIQTLPTQKKKQVLLIAVMTPVLIAGIVTAFTWFKNQQIKQAENKISPMIELFNQAQAIVDEDPFKARELSQESIDKLQQLRPYFDKKPYAKNILEETLNEQRTFYDSISGKEEFQSLTVYLDLQELENNLLASLVTANDDYLVIVDEGQKILLLVDLNTQQKYQFFLTQEIPDLENNPIKDLVLLENDIYLLANGIYKLKFSGDETASLNITHLKEEGDSDRAGLFINNYLSYFYIFNPDKRNIYRYNYSDENMSDPIGWLVSKEGIDFNQINDMTVDGDLWLSTKEGQIKKFTKGYEDTDFKLSGLPEELANPIYIYTKEDLDYLYIFDPQKNKMIILTKDGKFFKELKSPSLAGATDFAISQKNNKIFAISGSVIFEIPLSD